jgi:hypothetical protein
MSILPGKFSKKKEIEELKNRFPISAEFISLISNAIEEEFEDDIFEESYIVTSRSKVVGITNVNVMPTALREQIEVGTKDLMIRGKIREEQLVGLGESWFQRNILENIIGTLEKYKKKYRLFINPNAPFPILITTCSGNISVAPVVNDEKEIKKQKISEEETLNFPILPLGANTNKKSNV